MAREFIIQPDTNDLAAACAAVEPGDVIRFAAGVHSAPTMLARSGTSAAPIRITADAGAVIHGRQTGHPDLLRELRNGGLAYPRWTEDWAFLRLDGVEWIEIDDLREVRHCWPCFVHGRQVSHVSVRRCVIYHGTYPLFFRDPPAAHRLSSHLLVEDCEWQQDDSPGHDHWSESDWSDLHGDWDGDDIRKKFRHFNGAFFGSCDIGGPVRLRRNTIRDAFNGFRLGLSRQVRDLGDTAIRQCNRDVEISENSFLRIRDNPIEPEIHAHNWVVRHNTLRDCHTWFSMDAVCGGYWYIYGNVGGFTSRQGGEKSNTGKVLKFSSSDDEPLPDDHVYIFNNSWYLRCPVLAGDAPPNDYRMRGLRFLNNAIQYCDPQLAPEPGQPPLCEKKVRYIANLRVTPPPGLFDGTICNHTTFPDTLRRLGHEANGIVATTPIFADAPAGDLRLAAASPAHGSGLRFTLVLPDGRHLVVHPADRGAWQGGALMAVPELEIPAVA